MEAILVLIVLVLIACLAVSMRSRESWRESHGETLRELIATQREVSRLREDLQEANESVLHHVAHETTAPLSDVLRKVILSE